MRAWLAVGLLVAQGVAEAASCGGYPRAALQAAPGLCVGRVADAASGLRAPRRIVEVAPDRFWLVDADRLVEMTLTNAQPGFTTLIDRLDRPNGLVLGPDGKAYVAEAHRVWRSAVTGALRPEVVAGKLPSDGLHPMKEIAFDRENRLFVGIGAITDDCRQASGEQPAPCPESYVFQPRGAVYVVPLAGLDFKADAIGPYASGLRDPAALAFVAGSLLEAEGGPAGDELNLLRYAQHHGWPYCIADRRAAPGYDGRHDCSRSVAPVRLWPAGSGTRQMIVPTTGAWAGQLLVAWHGAGRVVAFTLGADGLPAGGPRTLLAGIRPAGIAVDRSDRLWIVDDQRRALYVVQAERK